MTNTEPPAYAPSVSVCCGLAVSREADDAPWRCSACGMAHPLRGGELLQICLEQATVFPESHDQDTWMRVSPCGSTACIAGHAVVLGSAAPIVLTPEFLTVSDDCLVSHLRSEGVLRSFAGFAAELLGLDEQDADALFSPDQDLDGLWALGEELYPEVVARPTPDQIAAIRDIGPLLRPALAAHEYVGERYLPDSARHVSGMVGDLIEV